MVHVTNILLRRKRLKVISMLESEMQQLRAKSNKDLDVFVSLFLWRIIGSLTEELREEEKGNYE